MNIKSHKKFYDLYPVTHRIISFIIKFLVWLICFFILGFLFGKFLEPKAESPSIIFSVCVIDSNVPQRIYLKELNNNKLCQENFNQIYEGNGTFYFNFEKVKKITPTISEWELESYNDSLSDPIVSRYQIDTAHSPNTVIPLWQTRGGFINEVLAWVGAFIMSFLFYDFLNKFHSKTLKNTEK